MLSLGLGLTLGSSAGNGTSPPAGYSELLGLRSGGGYAALKGELPLDGVTTLYGKVA